MAASRAGAVWGVPTGIGKTLHREWEDGERFSMLQIVSNFFNCCDRPFVAQVWTERMNLGEKRENAAVSKPTGIERSPSAGHLLKSPDQVQIHQTL